MNTENYAYKPRWADRVTDFIATAIVIALIFWALGVAVYAVFYFPLKRTSIAVRHEQLTNAPVTDIFVSGHFSMVSTNR